MIRQTRVLWLGILLAGLFIFSLLCLFLPALKQDVVFYLKPKSSTSLAVNDLYRESIIHHPWVLRVYIAVTRDNQLKTGEYAFAKGSSIFSMWRQMTTGSGHYYRPFTIVPGWTYQQVRDALQQNPWLKHVVSDKTNDDVKRLLAINEPSLEGMLYPDTYYFTRGESDLSVLARAYALMKKKLEMAYDARATDLPYSTPYDVLIVSSMIEKEGRVDSERPLIASVIVNRLKKKMLLQIDATVIFALANSYRGKLYKSDLSIDSPHNTYRYKGLPPTPIAMPGSASIEAALHPATSNYFYYVAKPDGSHQFSETLDDHHKAIKVIQKEAEHSQVNTVLLRYYLTHYMHLSHVMALPSSSVFSNGSTLRRVQ